MRHLGTILIGTALLTGCEKSTPTARNSSPPPQSDAAKKGAEMMGRLREMMLATPAEKLGIQRSDDFPRTYGALMDWPLGDGSIVSVAGLCDGNASLYTTSTFGVVGGVGHESVRKAAASFVKVADKFYADSVPTTDHGFPTGNRVKFFLVTFDSVRVIEENFDLVACGKSRFSELFNEAQRLITALRLVAETKAN
jgi:hypothetical protein